MNRTPVLVGLPLVLLAAGCQCKPAIPDDQPDKEDTAKTDTAPPPHTGDTGPDTVAGPCSIEEIEPNNSPETPMLLPLDTYLCGAFATALDADQYQLTLPEDGWLGVYFDAQIRGSLADGVLTIASEDAAVQAERDDDDASRDAHLVFPAPAGVYNLLVLEKNFNGDATNYYYELVATVAKDPFKGNATEIEPNDTSDFATTVRAGDRVEALLAEATDQDWYKIAVPAGIHTVTIDVDAYGLGSPANMTVFAYENGIGSNPTLVGFGLAGAGFDPYWSYESDGDETLYFRLEESTSKGGSAWWYGFVVSMEAS